MKIRLRHPVIISVLFHAGVVLGFVFYFNRHPLPLEPRAPQQALWVVQNAPSEKKELPALSHASRRAPEHAPGRTPKLKLGLVPVPSSGQSSAATSQAGGLDAYETADQMGLEQEGRLYPFFEELWRQVNAVTDYPKDFVEQEYAGTVSIQLDVDRRGVFTGNIRSVRGADPMLNALAVATVVQGLRAPLPESLWRKDGIAIALQFEYNLIGVGQEPKQVEHPHLKNLLSFRRDARVNPLINRAIEKFYTHYMPPIVPIPGGFYIDFPHLFTYVKNFIHPEPDQDDLRKERFEMRKEELEGFIRN